MTESDNNFAEEIHHIKANHNRLMIGTAILVALFFGIGGAVCLAARSLWLTALVASVWVAISVLFFAPVRRRLRSEKRAIKQLEEVQSKLEAMQATKPAE